MPLPSRALSPPRGVLDVADALASAGFEVWCVGGAVRDALMGFAHLDWDLATSATPEQVRAIFGRRRTVPIGLAFGTVGVLDHEGVLHEVTTFRRDVRTDGRHAEVEFGASLEEDLSRRDFTINAIAYSPHSAELRDPFGGRADLERRVIRAVGDPDARMEEDRLRALRAIRFAARFDFDIDPATRRAIERSAPFLGRLSPERVKQELEKTMEHVRAPSAALSLWRDTGALATLVPALAAIGAERLATLDCLGQPGPARRPARRLLRLTALFLDVEPSDAERALRALRFSNQDVARATRWLDLHRRLEPAMNAALLAGRIEERDVRRWVSVIGRVGFTDFFRLLAAVWDARRRSGVVAPERRDVHRLYRQARRVAASDQPLSIADLRLDGDDLRRAGIPAGPVMGKILQALLDQVLEDPSRNVPDRLLHEARYLHEHLTLS